MRRKRGGFEARPDVVEQQPFDRCLGQAGEQHPDQPAERRPEPANALDVKPGDQRHHVGNVLPEAATVGVREPVAASAPRQVRADHAKLVAELGPEGVKIAPVARQAVQADEHRFIARPSPPPHSR